MSKIKALITTLIIGTSSVAMADSSVTFHANAHASWGTPTVTAPIIRDHQKPAVRRGTWISLAEPMNLARGRGYIDLQSRTPLNQIRLQSTSGQAFISTITVQYTNGASQVVTLNQWIDARNPLAQFNLNRTAQVDSILIKGSRAMRSGKFQVFGYASSMRPEPPVYQPPVYQRIVQLANSMTLAQSRGSKEILVAANAGSFSKLRITGATGASPLSHILVSFTNGREQMLRIDRTLNSGDTLDLDLDLAGRGSIARLVVYQSYSNGWIRGTVGTFNVAAL